MEGEGNPELNRAVDPAKERFVKELAGDIHSLEMAKLCAQAFKEIKGLLDNGGIVSGTGKVLMLARSGDMNSLALPAGLQKQLAEEIIVKVKRGELGPGLQEAFGNMPKASAVVVAPGAAQHLRYGTVHNIPTLFFDIGKGWGTIDAVTNAFRVRLEEAIKEKQTVIGEKHPTAYLVVRKALVALAQTQPQPQGHIQ